MNAGILSKLGLENNSFLMITLTMLLVPVFTVLFRKTLFSLLTIAVSSLMDLICINVIYSEPTDLSGDGLEFERVLSRVTDKLKSRKYKVASFSTLSVDRVRVHRSSIVSRDTRGFIKVDEKYIHVTVTTDKNDNQSILFRFFLVNIDFVNEYINKLKEDKRLFYYGHTQNTGFVRIKQIKHNSNFYLDPTVKKTIDDAVALFLRSKEIYTSKNIPWKLSILLYGPPGTGKSTIIKYLSTVLNKSIISIEDIAGNTTPSNKIALIKHKGIVTCEDIDTLPFTKARVTTVIVEEVGADVRKEKSLSNFLNLIQGVLDINGSVFVLTTNDIESLDPAITRDGRVDLKLEIGYLTIANLMDVVKFYYELDDIEISEKYNDIKFTQAQASHAFKNNMDNPQGFLTALLNTK